eukprot:tig00000388_g24790.t1
MRPRLLVLCRRADDQPEVAAPAEPAQRAATFGVRFSGRSSQGLADAVASSGRGSGGPTIPEGFDPLGKVAPRAQVTTNAKAKAAAAAVTQKEKVMAAAAVKDISKHGENTVSLAPAKLDAFIAEVAAIFDVPESPGR